MAALASFSFRGYTLRPACADVPPKGKRGGKIHPGLYDLQHATVWTKADPHHRHKTPPEFWLEQGPGVESYMMEDRYGPLLFFKMVRGPEKTVEMHVQFPPYPHTPTGRAELRCRIVHALMLGFEWLERVLSLRGVESLSFVCDTPTLRQFCIKRLQFVQDKGTRLRKVIARPQYQG